uniref:CCHC-type domain-containing protein n=1 Tax=Cannabis sativa TaxID=3483 RepID=A0A803PUK2_CANSA
MDLIDPRSIKQDETDVVEDSESASELGLIVEMLKENSHQENLQSGTMVETEKEDQNNLNWAKEVEDETRHDEEREHLLKSTSELLEQSTDYEWLSVKCKNCQGYGHIMADCRKEEIKKGNQKAKVDRPEATKNNRIDVEAKIEKEEEKTTVPNKEESQEKEARSENDNKRLVTPKRTAPQKHFRVTSAPREEQDETPQLFHCYVKMVGHLHAFCITFVYGFNTIDDRKNLSRDLSRLKHPVKPGLILCDFNPVFNFDDRSGHSPISSSDLVDFNDWISKAYVEALMSTRSRYRIYSKIDHVFANEDWYDMFTNSIAHFGWETISNHCSCVVTTRVEVSIGVKPFRYYNFWAIHPKFRDLVLSTKTTKYRFHPMCKFLRLINLYFVDDLILFSKGSSQSLDALTQVLEEFNNASGLQINSKKSHIYFGDVDPREKLAMLSKIRLA